MVIHFVYEITNENTELKIGESYNEEEFVRRLLQGIGEIAKYERGVEGNGVQSFEHRKQKNPNSISEDDGQRIDRSLKGLKSKDITQRFIGKSPKGDNVYYKNKEIASYIERN